MEGGRGRLAISLSLDCFGLSFSLPETCQRIPVHGGEFVKEWLAQFSATLAREGLRHWKALASLLELLVSSR